MGTTCTIMFFWNGHGINVEIQAEGEKNPHNTSKFIV